MLVQFSFSLFFAKGFFISCRRIPASLKGCQIFNSILVLVFGEILLLTSSCSLSSRQKYQNSRYHQSEGRTVPSKHVSLIASVNVSVMAAALTEAHSTCFFFARDRIEPVKALTSFITNQSF